MSFTAQDVKALREQTGVGMMECKKALVEADGDMEKAIDVLRERGLAASVKKSGRTAADGVVYAYTDEAAKVSVLVEVNSETDFVAKNEKFQAFVADVAKTIAAENPADVEALEEMKLAGSDRTVKETVQDLVLAIGENMKIRRFVRTEGISSSYIHMGGAVGVLVNFDTTDEVAATEEFKVMGKDVAMQIAAMSPSYLDPAAVPADVLEHETEILKAQMKEDPKMANKPEQVLANIVKGKLGKYYKENCLLNQEFVKAENHEDVAAYVASVAKKIGGDIKVTGFTRYAKGEGIEKKEENFAAEIASMVK
ncbi:MAG: elongation factor Ts [Clostridia bacterium]|jgi:translation elongation factor Ts|nr:elongation factor Ts [Oscillospiraceae bacterium]MBQ2568689.1 elongation factor Ts [Clostridia bacterium]MBQ3326894.1 elongation factor Ts [Clostridia bacterium]MBQ3996131.1 elongation factor Ts [Clostridia bacterium]MBQ6525252.1 elongation factor Ts [Clostridia bacterium]